MKDISTLKTTPGSPKVDQITFHSLKHYFIKHNAEVYQKKFSMPRPLTETDKKKRRIQKANMARLEMGQKMKYAKFMCYKFAIYLKLLEKKESSVQCPKPVEKLETFQCPISE